MVHFPQVFNLICTVFPQAVPALPNTVLREAASILRDRHFPGIVLAV
jgi:hypothetical protein